jgi:hypothetical protein
MSGFAGSSSSGERGSSSSSSSSSERGKSNRPPSSIYDRSLMKPRGEVSLSAFALLFSEMVQYSQNRVESIADLERKLEEAGYGIGQRVIEMVGARERITKRETRIVNMLQFVSNVVWRHLFNKAADNLEKSMENEDEYMIHENSPVTNAFVSVPADMGQLNCAAFLAGIIAGVLDSAKFHARVTAHSVPAGDGGLDKTVFLVKFSSEVMARERRMG